MNRVIRLGLAIAGLSFAGATFADSTLLNVSYDVTRELYKDINPAFQKVWQADPKNGVLTINQSHGGSSKQVLSVQNGLEADVVTMNQATDIDLLAKSGLVSTDWRKQFPNGAAPYSSTTVFLVRQGNPKNIKDWSDLIRPDVAVILANPKTSGNGRYAYLAAWGYAKKKFGSDEKAKEFTKNLLAHVPVLDAGGRGATTTFTQRGIGDVLITFENEAFLVDKEISDTKFDVIYPSISIQADAPVAIVNKVVDKKDTRAVAKAYLDFLYSPEAQEVIAKNYLRPRLASVAKKYNQQFKPIKLFTVEDVFGGWDKAQQTHFVDGGSFDQIYEKK
ncbi:MAG: sulfate ABC transporter substrate-binding protein [Agitococcus sp.]|nr:sulfate ABC transporter substrate-binding protein [Agitococcus sp.]